MLEKWDIVIQANGFARTRPGKIFQFAFFKLCDPDVAMWFYKLQEIKDENCIDDCAEE